MARKKPPLDPDFDKVRRERVLQRFRDTCKEMKELGWSLFGASGSLLVIESEPYRLQDCLKERDTCHKIIESVPEIHCGGGDPDYVDAGCGDEFICV